MDNIWYFVPSTRRVRRVSPATRSDSVAGLDFYSADFDGFDEKIEYFHWKVIGQGAALAPFTDLRPLRGERVSGGRYRIELPYPKAAYETRGSRLAPWAITDHLQLVQRPVWIVELLTDDPYYNFGKVILWVDRELYRVYWRQAFNKEGQEFYDAMIAHHFTTDPDGKNPSVSWTAIMGLHLRAKRAALIRKSGSETVYEVPPPAESFPAGPCFPMAD